MHFAHLQILQIFHRKVYPESTALARSLTKKSRKRGSSGGGADEPEPASPKLRCRKEQHAPGFGCCANRASFGGATSPTVDEEELNSSKTGHWIRTDAECECMLIRPRLELPIHRPCNDTTACHPNPTNNLQSQNAVLIGRLPYCYWQRIFRSYQFVFTVSDAACLVLH